MERKSVVRRNPSLNRFEVEEDGAMSILTYAESPKELVLLHTEVPQSLRDHGIGGTLAGAALDYARSKHLAVVPRCPFIADFIERNIAYADLVERA